MDWKASEQLKNGQSIPVSVTILDEPAAPLSVEDRGRRMAEILGRLAAINALKHITDPLAWEREMRVDRPLPDRKYDASY